MIDRAEDKLRQFLLAKSIPELLLEIQKSYSYQQHIMVQSFTRKKPIELYVMALISSQSNVSYITEIIIEKAKEEGYQNGSEKING